MTRCSTFKTALEHRHSMLTTQWLFNQRPKNAEGSSNEKETAINGFGRTSFEDGLLLCTSEEMFQM